MLTIIGQKKREIFDDWERELHKSGLREAIAELQSRLAKLEALQGENSVPAAVDDKLFTVSNLTESPKIPKRRPGRPKGTRRRRWSEKRKEMHRAKQERRAEEIRNNPRAQALMAMFSGPAGVRQADGSEKPNMTADGQ